MSLPSLSAERNLSRSALLILSIAIILLFFAIPLIWGRDNIPPRVYFGNSSLTGKISDAQNEVVREANVFEKKPIAIVFQGKKINATLEDLGLEVDKNKTYSNLDSIFAKEKLSPKYFFKWWGYLILGFKTPTYYSFNVSRFEKLVGGQFNINLLPTQEAGVQFLNDNINLVSAKEGMGIDTMIVVAQMIKNLKNWRGEEVNVRLANLKPDITTEEANGLKQELDHLLNYPFALQALNYNFKLPRSKIISWIDIQKIENQGTDSLNGEDDINIITNVALTGKNFVDSKKKYALKWEVNKDKVKNFLEQEVQSLVYKKPVNGTLAFENGAIVEAAPSQSETTVDINKAVEIINQSFKKGDYFIGLPVKENSAPLSMQKVKELGIDNLIGVGESNFVGSPNNRKHNIAVGASKFNGVIIGQGEEFSFLTTLGPVDESTGYLPELVIKQDKTVPEFGGGMCQVSTTSFRAAVNAGLRVTERQNHAYPVQYYSPQGTDATVYIPHPDLKFVNDTPAPILVQTRIVGNLLTFEYFGKSDSRRVELQGPRVWDKKSDGSMKAEWIQKVFDKNGDLMFQKNFLSKYDSPSKYPHPGDEKPPQDKKKKKKKKN